MAKSIIDIELKAEAFEKFAALFNKYNEQLSKMPGKWDKVGDAADKSTKSFDGAVEALNRAATAMENLAESQRKVNANQDKFNKHVSASERAFGNIRKNIGGVLKDVTATTAHLLKWAGMGAALGAIGMGGSLFGVATLASGVSDNRRQAQGLGVSSGELRAANLNFSRYVDTMSTMSNIAEAQTDPNRKWAFGAAGVDIQRNAADILPQLMREAARIYRQDPANAAARLQARGFTELGVSVADARRLASLKEEELNTAIKKYEQDKKVLEVNDSLQRQWQDLDVQLERSKQNIVTAFITGLTPLIPNIEKFSESVAEAIKTFLANPELKVWLQDFGEGIKSLAEAMPDILKWIPGTKANAAAHTAAVNNSTILSGLRDLGTFADTGETLATRRQRMMNFWTGAGMSPERAAGITGNAEFESGGLNPFARNKQGNYGLFQWDTNRRKAYEKYHGHSIESVKDYEQAMREQMEFALYELKTSEKGAGRQLSQAMTTEQATSAFYSGFERPGAADTSLGSRTSMANAAYAAHINSLRRNSVSVTMQNNTGGSATAVIGAAATPDLGYSAFAGAQ